MHPTIGRIVHYKLNDTDADLITQRRNRIGTLALMGNMALAGHTYPAAVVRVFSDDGEPVINLQVLLDGNDTYWATSRKEGTEPGTWCWPPRV